ncbi:hypothetical protein NC651_029501 [Populus alba x Populus x berolinensis]|nr:hypothetical protein NC651_029501 [Populus alba x Populus x berolinensis]
MNAYLSPESHANLATTSDFITNLTTTITYAYQHPKHQTKQNKTKIRIFEQTHQIFLTSLPLQLSSSTSLICTLNAVTLTKPSDMVTISRDRESICS